MATIGIRELRQHASTYVRRAEAGETLWVADRGRPVALLGPFKARSGLERLEAAGNLTRETGDLLALGRPLTHRRKSASKALDRARKHER